MVKIPITSISMKGRTLSAFDEGMLDSLDFLLHKTKRFFVILAGKGLPHADFMLYLFGFKELLIMDTKAALIPFRNQAGSTIIMEMSSKEDTDMLVAELAESSIKVRD